MLSIAPLFFDTESTWNNDTSLQQRSTCGNRRVKGVRRIGVRLGNWLTAEQGRSLVLKSQGDSLRCKRNHAILALLIGCGLRRGELLALTVNSIQLREDHWVIADLHGKAGHIRTVPIPLWVKEAIDRWTEASGIKEGCLFRAINKSGQIWGHGMTPKALWEIVKKAAEAAGIDNLAPHDLRINRPFPTAPIYVVSVDKLCGLATIRCVIPFLCPISGIDCSKSGDVARRLL